MLNLKEQIAHISRNAYISDLLDSIQNSLVVTENNAKELEKAIIVNADESTIAGWEEWMKLSIEPTWDLQDRIDRVIYTINSRGFFTVQFLKDQSLIFENGEIEVNENFPAYSFEIEFISVIGNPPNLDAYAEMVDINKPAKLVYTFKFKYRTHDELKPYIHNTLKNYTHEELRSRGTINI